MTNPALSESPEAALLRQELADALGDRYQLGEILGGGRAGIVFRAKSAELGYDVAIKTAWHDDLSRAQMLRELTLTAEVNHPNVVEMRQVDAPTGMIVVEMPLLTGYTAHDFLENGKPVPFEKVAQFIRGLADALDTAHSAGIIHAGLCPVKILLDAKGQAVLSDFGLRAPAYPGHWYDDLPDSIGAPAYTPLEQRHNEAHLDGRIDQYALAIIAFELIRGRRTWHVNEDRVVEVEPLEITQGRAVAPGVPTTANMALRRATSRDPAYRYATVSQFAEAFAGKAPAVVAAEHIHRETVVEKRRPPYALVGVFGVLAILAAFSRQTVRDGVGDWWKTKTSEGAAKEIFPRDRPSDPSSRSSSSDGGPPTPPPPSREESKRLFGWGANLRHLPEECPSPGASRRTGAVLVEREVGQLAAGGRSPQEHAHSGPAARQRSVSSGPDQCDRRDDGVAVRRGLWDRHGRRPKPRENSSYVERIGRPPRCDAPRRRRLQPPLDDREPEREGHGSHRLHNSSSVASNRGAFGRGVKRLGSLVVLCLEK